MNTEKTFRGNVGALSYEDNGQAAIAEIIEDNEHGFFIKLQSWGDHAELQAFENKDVEVIVRMVDPTSKVYTFTMPVTLSFDVKAASEQEAMEKALPLAQSIANDGEIANVLGLMDAPYLSVENLNGLTLGDVF